MLNLLFFAWVKERMGKPEERVQRPAEVATVADLVTWLSNRDPAGAKTFAQSTLIRAAINQEFAEPDSPIHDGDEIAFFPPVTGG